MWIFGEGGYLSAERTSISSAIRKKDSCGIRKILGIVNRQTAQHFHKLQLKSPINMLWDVQLGGLVTRRAMFMCSPFWAKAQHA